MLFLSGDFDCIQLRSRLDELVFDLCNIIDLRPSSGRMFRVTPKTFQIIPICYILILAVVPNTVKRVVAACKGLRILKCRIA